MDVGPAKIEPGKLQAFMEELKELSYKHGIFLEACECGGGFEPMLIPEQIKEDGEWEYVRVPEDLGNHYQFCNEEDYEYEVAEDIGEPHPNPRLN